MPAAGGCNPAAKEPPPRQMAARQTRRTAASRRPTAIVSRNKERNEYTQYGNETLGQGLRARQDDRGIYRRQRPRTGHAAGALRRPGLAGAYRHARNDRAADGRRTGKADGGTERDRRRDRGRALRNRTRHRGCPLAGGADAHPPPGRRRQENPLGPLAQRPGAGRPQTVPARRTASDRRSRKNGLRPPANAQRAVQGDTDAGIHPPSDRHAFVVRPVVRRLRRNAGGRHAAHRRGMAHRQPEPPRLSRRVRLVVPARP